MARELRDARVWLETFTGLCMERFARLLWAVRERGVSSGLAVGTSSSNYRFSAKYCQGVAVLADGARA